MQNNLNKKILISGGGIGGCALAYFLKEQGFTPTVVESAPEFKHLGYLLALNQQIGQVIAKKMGILEKLKTFEVPLTKNSLYDIYENKITSYELDLATHNKRVGIMINRADLHQVLFENIKNSVDFRMNEQIQSLVEKESDVLVTFASGKTESFDLVIGADGVHSKTRNLIFEEGFEKHLGQAYFAFTADNVKNIKVADKNEAVVVRGEDFVISYLHLSEKEISGYVFHQEKDTEKLEPKNRKSYLLENYGKYNLIFKSILEMLKDDTHIFHDKFTQIIMPKWSKGRVCLVGDSSYCPTPASGVGATMALAGAYILAKKLSENADYIKAFQDYESYMRPYILETQKKAIGMAKLSTGKSFISYGFTNWLLKVLPLGLVSRIHTHDIKMPLP